MAPSQKAFALLIGLAAITAVGFPLFAPAIFPATGWVAYAAAAFTLLGWLTREFFAIRAMRKQHTVTILLQSRLSTAFNDRYKAIIRIYPVIPKVTPVQAGDWNDKDKVEAIEALKYFLNCDAYIQHCRTADEEVYKNLLWLRDRWTAANR